jgi:hypothetical protein
MSRCSIPSRGPCTSSASAARAWASRSVEANVEVIAGPHGGDLRVVDQPSPAEFLDDLGRVALQGQLELDQATKKPRDRVRGQA